MIRHADGHSGEQDVKTVVGSAHQHVKRSLNSIHHSLGTIQRTRDRILTGQAAAVRVENRYQQQLLETLENAPPDVIRRIVILERMTAATAISAELVELGLQLVESSRRRLLGA